MRLKNGSVLGTFSKGVDGSVSVNFGISGGASCDISCRQHPDNTDPSAPRMCYAVRAEIRPDRAQLLAKMQRHAKMPGALVCGRALLEMQQLAARGKRIPWLRISTNGSVPQPADVRGNNLFRAAFRALLSYCRAERIPVHCPVESWAKARFYRALAGDLATIRESAQTVRRFFAASGSVSTVVGDRSDTRIQRVSKCRSVARERREKTGRKTVVCPAVTNLFAACADRRKLNANAKCGNCKACADPLVDIVYPLH